LIEFICKAIIESEHETRKTKEALNFLEERWNKDTSFREKSAPKRALKVLLKYPIITSSLLETELQIKSTASDDAIKALIKNKIIRFRRVENRQRVYAAEEVIQILSRPFGEEIEISLEKAKLLLEQEI
jgi:predicted HTH transcriptional regulator